MGDRQAARHTDDDLLARIRAALPGLAPTQQILARAALSDPIGTAQLTITRWAETTGTSPATITRFYHQLGLDSYAQLRLQLATAASEATPAHRQALTGDVTARDSLAEVVGKLAAAESQVISETSRLLDVDALERVVAAIAAARQVIGFGVGAGGSVADYLQHKLRSLGVAAIAFTDQTSALFATANAGPGDVVVVISQTGATRDSASLLAEARLRGCTTVGITANTRSALASDCDLVLSSVSSDSSFRTGALRSRSGEVFIVDCISTGLVVATHDRSMAALSRVQDAAHRHDH